MNDTNHKIGAWALYGTIGGVIALGVLHSIISDGLKPLLTLVLIILGILLYFYLIQQLPEPLPAIVIIATGIFVYLLNQDWMRIAYLIFIFGGYMLLASIIKHKRMQQLLTWFFFVAVLVGMIYFSPN